MTKQDVNWISVGALAEGFAPDSNKLSMTDDLVGRTMALAFEDGTVARYQFFSGERLLWNEGGLSGESNYYASTIRPGLYFIDHVRSGTPTETSVSLVIDVDTGVATVVVARLPDSTAAHGSILARAQQRQELTLVEAEFKHASIGLSYTPSDASHKKTTDLTGLRIRHRYSPTELYEHIYLNENKYCWHCIQGREQGLGDVDLCHYYSIRSNLYLFIWREKIVPTVGVVLLDLDALKTTGKIFGYEDDAFTRTVNFPMGAYSTIANRTPSGL